MVTNTQIPNGYKQTDVGIIPEDWEVKKLGNVCKYQNGTSLERYFNPNDGYRVISIGNYSPEGKYVDTRTFIDRGHKRDIRKFILNKNDLTMILNDKTSTGTILGRVLFIDQSDTYVMNQRTMRLTADPEMVDYLYLLINSDLVHSQIVGLSKPGTQIYVNTSDVTGIDIPLPLSKNERDNISQALFDIGDLISKLDELIEKKRNIKQGVMQELLTGKRRLPGFSGEWEEKKLGMIGEITGAGIDKKIKEDEIPVRLVNYMDVAKSDFIFSNLLNHWVTSPPAQLSRCAVKVGDIFFTPSSETREDIGLSAVAMEDIPDAGYSYHVVRLRTFEDWDLVFRTYIFKVKDFLDQTEKMCEGSGKRYVLTLKRFRDLNIKYPQDIKEQNAIAEILLDIDKEIESLNQQKIKFIDIKQGMMQQLLTGKIRLV